MHLAYIRIYICIRYISIHIYMYTIYIYTIRMPLAYILYICTRAWFARSGMTFHVYIYQYICVYLYIYIYTIYMHLAYILYIYTQALYARSGMTFPVYIYQYIHIYVYIYIYICIYYIYALSEYTIYMHSGLVRTIRHNLSSIYITIQTYIYIYIFTYMYIYIYIYVPTHSYTLYTCTYSTAPLAWYARS